MEENPTTKEAKEIEEVEEALRLMEAVVVMPGPEGWAKALGNPERALSVGVPEIVHNFYKDNTARLLDLVLHRVILQGLRALMKEIGKEEMDRRMAKLESLWRGGKNGDNTV